MELEEADKVREIWTIDGGFCTQLIGESTRYSFELGEHDFLFNLHDDCVFYCLWEVFSFKLALWVWVVLFVNSISF